MKIMISGIDYTEPVRAAYQESASLIDLPELDKIEFSTVNKQKAAYGWASRENGHYNVCINTRHIMADFEKDEWPIAISALTKHELIHIWELKTYGKAGHGKNFYTGLKKLGLPISKYTSNKVIQEAREMKSKLNVGGINIDMLKQAAGLMGMTFEEYLEKTGMKAVIETAEVEQKKVAEKAEAEKEKAEFELLKAKVETFKSAREMRITSLKSEIEQAFQAQFSEDEREKIDFKVDFTFKVNVKGAAKQDSGDGKGTRGPQEQSKWKLFVDDIEIDGVPADSNFTSSVDECMNRWNWLYYEVCKAKKRDIPTFVFSRRTSLAGVAGLYKSGTKDFDWKAAAKDGRLGERISVDLDRIVRIEEVEKEAA